MYAVLKTGSKQYKVTEGVNIRVERLEGQPGSKVTLSEVLLVGGQGQPRIGTPTIKGASVSAEILGQGKDRKVLVYKKKRRKGYEKKYGHRQPFTELKITKINLEAEAKPKEK